MNTVILVPRRAGFPERDELWRWCKRWWQEHVPDIRMVEGHHDHGLFNRSAAINTAAEIAGNWDVALIIDSDVILDDPLSAESAAFTAHDTGKLVVAFTIRNNLDRLSTQRLLDGHDKEEWSRGIERVYKDQHSSVIAVPRPLWDEVGGFDEHFTGWGHEDTGFAIACETFAGPRVTLPGIVWHLWHAHAPEKRQSPSRVANWNRAKRYEEAWGDKAAMRAILDEAYYAPGSEAIPPILHRVVPEHTSATVERWWQEFGALHPGWRQMTWRDPLDPAQFPLTSSYWPKAKTGATLADLVRLEVLLQWGGIYVDSDFQPFRRLDPLLQLKAFAAWEDHNTVPNAVLGASRGHPAVQACLDLMLDRMEKNESKVWQLGPGVTTDILPIRDDVLLLPPESWYPVHYKDPDRDRKMREFDPKKHPATFAMHWYAASWMAKERQHPLPGEETDDETA